MTQKLKSLSVFFPAYNEEANLPQLLAQAQEVFPQYAQQYELIIVNDGSTDHTLAVAKSLQQQYPNLRVVSHAINKGYGESLKTGIRKARYDWIFWTDADLQFDLHEFDKFAAASRDYSIIIGYRVRRAEGLQRSILVSILKFGVDTLFRLHVKDIDCAFKLMRTEQVKSLSLQSGSAFTTSEILYLLKKKHLPFKEIPVQHYPRVHGVPSGANIKVLWRALVDAFHTYFYSKMSTLKKN